MAVPESGAGLPPFRAEVDADPLAPATIYTYLSITKMDAYQDKSFEELRWEHYSEGNTLEAAEPPAAAQPPPPHMCRNLVHPPVLRYQAISRNLRLFWDAMGVVCA